MTPEQQVDLDCRRVTLPSALIYYPAGQPITMEVADQIRSSWIEASKTGSPIILPDNWKVEVL